MVSSCLTEAKDTNENHRNIDHRFPCQQAALYVTLAQEQWQNNV